jgi:putative DNA primase/helicase
VADQIPVSLEDLRVLLRFIPADSRETWVQVGMGIKDEFGTNGWDAWDTWSQSGTGYKLSDAKSVWKSFRKAGTGLGTVIKLAMDNGWTPEKTELSAEDKRRFAREHEARRIARQAEVEADEALLERMRAKVAAECAVIWAQHTTTDGKSAYLDKKQVGAFGIGFMRHTVVLEIDDQAERCQLWVGEDAQQYLKSVPSPRPAHLSMLVLRRGDMVMPLCDEAGRLHSLQQVSSTGKKLFPKYGRKSGCFHVLASLSAAELAKVEVIGLAEGYATAASCQMAMGWAMVAGIDSGNLPKVAAALRALNPTARLVLCGDDDPTVAGNPGRTKAELAAQQCGAVAVFPQGVEGKDWNDLHVGLGLDAVREQLQAALLLEPARAVKSATRITLEELDALITGDLPRSPSDDCAPENSTTGTTGGAGEGLTLAQVIRRYALVEGTTQVWDIDKALLMKKPAFEALVGKPLVKDWMALVDGTRRGVSADHVRDIQQAKRLTGKKGGALGMPPVERYVYIDGTKDVWDKQKKRRVPEGAVKMALGDAYALWLNSAERRVVDVDHIVFDPTMTKDPSVYINTYDGLPLEPVRNDAACANLVWLIDFLCNHDEPSRDWLVRWLAYPLQHPGAKMDTAVLMHSIMEGSGKSLLFADAMGELYGQYAATVGQTQLESNFNAWQSRKLWSVFEEVVSRDQRYNQVGKIKHLITGKTVRMESKFINGWEEANHMNAVFLSNEILPWPISESDRRMLVMWPMETLPAVRQKAIGAELRNGGVAALYAWLLAVDLGDFDQRTRPPKTDARERLVALSRAAWQTFVHLWRVGELGANLWGGCLSTDLYALFSEWCQRNKEHQLSHTKFSLFVSAEVEKTRSIPWSEGTSRRFGAFFFPSDLEPSPAPSLTAAQLGKMVDKWREAAQAAGWNVSAWDHVKAVAA